MLAAGAVRGVVVLVVVAGTLRLGRLADLLSLA